MLDGLYILNETGRCILTFPINGIASDTTTFASCIPSETAQNDWTKLVEITASQLLYIRKYKHLYIFVPCGVTSPPIMIEQLTKRLVEVVEAYFHNTMTDDLISKHRAEMVCILSEMLDTSIPRITQPDIMRQLVYKEDFLSKLMGTTTLQPSHGGSAAGSGSGSGAGASTSLMNSGSGRDISAHRIPDALAPWEFPWRRSRVKHGKEELFVDIIEHASVVARSKPRSPRLSRPGPVHVRGEVRVLSRLSDVPHVTIDLSHNTTSSSSGTSGLSLNETQLHPAVDLEKFQTSQGHTLELTPPDLESVIAKYTTTLRDSAPVAISLVRDDSSSRGGIAGGTIGGTTSGDGSFEVRVSTEIHTRIEHVSDLTVKIAFPPTVKFVRELSATSGDLDVANPQLCVYRLAPVVPMGWSATLRGVANDEDGNAVAPLYVDMSYNLIGRIPSQTSVRSIHISPQKFRNQEPGPYKGVRYRTVMDSHVVS